MRSLSLSIMTRGPASDCNSVPNSVSFGQWYRYNTFGNAERHHADPRECGTDYLRPVLHTYHTGLEQYSHPTLRKSMLDFHL